jgi:hypothetical protein
MHCCRVEVSLLGGWGGARPIPLRKVTTQLRCAYLSLQTEAPATDPLSPGASSFRRDRKAESTAVSRNRARATRAGSSLLSVQLAPQGTELLQTARQILGDNREMNLGAASSRSNRVHSSDDAHSNH